VWDQVLDRLSLLEDGVDEKRAPAPAVAPAPFWQSMSPNHPTAHLWTRTGMNEHHAACGMATQRAPSGSADAGHCSSCVRAAWPPHQAPAVAPEVAPADVRRMTPGAHAQALTLLVSIRTDLITDRIDQAETHARQLLKIIVAGEAED
jgi:hypothetical protein